MRDFEVKHSVLAKGVALIVTIILLALLFSQIDLSDIVTTIANIDPLYLVAGFFLYTSSYFFRALRFHILLNREVGLRTLFRIVCVHNMVNGILPARTGELSYIYLLKKVDGRNVGEGVSTLTIARIFDFIAITICFLISFIIIGEISSTLVQTAWMVGVFMIAMVLSLFFLLHSGRKFIYAIHILFNKCHLVKWRFGDCILKCGEEAVESLEKIKETGNNQYIFIFLVSCGIWVSLYLLIFLLVSGMEIHIGFFLVLFASTFAIISTVLPIQGIGGFGTVEGAWSVGFILVGLPNEVAINSGFVYHIVYFIYLMLLGIGGSIALRNRLFIDIL
ncbi:MAG: lysylphosphatidylglycerol synthase transmembrane domain-containing protein [Methanofollis sp.]|uniref:lysylphosphatidylglycerol synthase transmembrane domain-containing protein n=1 Tax=Methanofollis sp. TaxID=2052835 RepID=UPI00262BA7DF|nr:lysylphosphatidylglycerol synthase transmembrane domain-containing protein [Methanofollis sp.]MDD4254483.1 lysylphosphatidylglycerol synthase transmembrane domain-containing protein [Methanofollis sp.]